MLHYSHTIKEEGELIPLYKLDGYPDVLWQEDEKNWEIEVHDRRNRKGGTYCWRRMKKYRGGNLEKLKK